MSNYLVLAQWGHHYEDRLCINADSVLEAVEILEEYGYDVLSYSEDSKTITVSP